MLEYSECAATHNLCVSESIKRFREQQRGSDDGGKK